MKFFKKKEPLVKLIESYFTSVDDIPPGKKPEPPTLAGLALHLGFNSKEDLDIYEQRGRFKFVIKQARLRVMTYYESRLYAPNPTGAMFALKNMGWDINAKTDTNPQSIQSIKVNLIETGPPPASSEKEVQL
ncbi:MAG: hypothetical protein H7289_07370 [Mucilaginibacter sp.]|nr:hypothetical protein [Mucilaginibacter sp.]